MRVARLLHGLTARILLVFAVGLLLDAGIRRLLQTWDGVAVRATAFMVALAGTAWVVDRLAPRRIRRLNRDLADVAAGNLALRMSSTVQDEVGELTAGIESLV